MPSTEKRLSHLAIWSHLLIRLLTKILFLPTTPMFAMISSGKADVGP
jgi:hypothetical protein